MKKIQIYLLLCLVPMISIAQPICDDLSCLQYLLGTDPSNHQVSNFIAKHGGRLFIENDKSAKEASFHFFTKKSIDNRDLISRVWIDNPDAIKMALNKMPFEYFYEKGRKTWPSKYTKVKKKYNAKTIAIENHDAFMSPNNDFSDCWRGEIKYDGVNGQNLIVGEIRYELTKGMETKAIEYNPVGWHSFDRKETLKRTVCKTGNCVVCCGLCQTDNIKGVSKEKDPNSSGDLKIIDVLETELPLPLNVSKSVSFKTLHDQFGDYQGLPWYKPTLEKDIVCFYSGNGIKFHFRDDRLVKISAGYVSCSKDLVPEAETPFTSQRLSGASTPDSPGIIIFKEGIIFTYYGELENGVPHGFGALTRPPINENSGPRKAIFGNYFQNGAFAGYQEQVEPICLSENCLNQGLMLTSLGIYEGPILNGIPAGIGELKYTYDLSWDRYNGTFKNGLPYSEDGEITLFNGGKYKGRVEHGKPNGNGTRYNKFGKVDEEGWYENGIRKGPPKVTPKPKSVNIFTYNPKNENWESSYLPRMMTELSGLKGFHTFGNLGDNYHKSTSYCIKWDYKVTGIDYLIECLRNGYRDQIFGKATASFNLIETVWKELDATFDHVSCAQGNIEDAVKNVRVAYEKYSYHAENIENYQEAIIAQLKVREVQSNLNLAKQIYTNGISGFQSNMNSIDGHLNRFINELSILNNYISEQRCYWHN